LEPIPQVEGSGVLRLLFLLSAATAPLFAGEIFGDLRLGDKYLAVATLQLTCGAAVAETKTDSTGSFRLRVNATGRCQLTVTHDNQTASVDVVVFDKPARYRLVLESKDGKYALRRV
jgi:hypothetical protein